MHIPDLIIDLALMLTVAGITTLLFKKIRQPLVLGYIVAGFLIGPYLNFFPSVQDTVNIQTWSEIGIIILMFSLGLEFNLHKLASVGGTAIITAITEVVCMLAIGFACGQLMGWGTMNSIFLGGMLSMSSTTIIIKAFDDLNLRGKKFTELVFGTLVIEDIAGIFMMVMLSTLAVSQGISGGEFTSSILKMVFYLALWLILGIYLIPSFLKKAQELINDETLLIVSLGICFAMVLLAHYLGFSSALGAFVAGSLLAGTLHAERIEHISKPIKDLFGAVFFISVGMMVDPALVVQYAGPIIFLTLVTIFGKALFSTLGVLFSGQSLRTSILCGCSLAQIGEFSFIIAALGISLGVTSYFIYPIIVSVSVITTFTTPFVINSADNVYALINKCLPPKASHYLNRFTADDQAETEKDRDWGNYIKSYFSNLALYSVILFGITFAGTWGLGPFLKLHLPETLASALTVGLTLLAMSPFLRQCLFQKSEYFVTLWFQRRSNHMPLGALILLRSIILLLLVMLPIRIVFDFSPFYILFVASVVLVLVARADWLIAPYLKIEARFLANFNERQLEEQKNAEGDLEHQWLDEQVYVSRYTCSPDYRFLNQNLAQLNTIFGIGIMTIKIVRQAKHINIPEASEKLLEGDTVYIVGNQAELDNFQLINALNLEKKKNGDYLTLHEFIIQQNKFKEEDQLLCYAVKVEKNSPLIGLSIKDSKIKRDWGALLLGIERSHYPIISPDINFKIELNDLIWVLGPQRMTGKLVKAQIL